MKKIGQISIFVIIGIITILIVVAGFFMFGNNSTEEENYEPVVDDVHEDSSTEIHIVEVNMNKSGSGYSLDDLTINVGDTVRWVQTEMMAHTVTSDDNSDGMMNMGDGELFSSGNMEMDDVYEFTFNEDGEFLYYCDYHLMPMHGMMPMKGKVTVGVGSTSSETKQESENMMETTETIMESQTYNIEIKGHVFSPKTLTIKKDDIVVWTNMDSSKHTVTSDSGNELDSVLLSKQETYSNTFDKVGTYNYVCSVHSNMKGTIIVE